MVQIHSPDHLFKTNNLRHAKERETAWCKTRRSAFRFHRADRSNSRCRRGLAPRLAVVSISKDCLNLSIRARLDLNKLRNRQDQS